MSNKETKKVVELNMTELAEFHGELSNLLREKNVHFAVKYRISKTYEEVNAIVVRFNKQRNDIFKEFGICTNEARDLWTLKDSPKEKEGYKELRKLIDLREPINASFNLDDFANIESTNGYIHLMKFIKE